MSCVAIANAGLRVWTVTETRHVLRSEPPGSGINAQVSAARNEWVSFQILLRSDTPAKRVRLQPGDLKGPGKSVLQGADARLYRQHQVHPETGTYRNEGFKPDWYPDPLIPFAHPMTGNKLEGAQLVAVPFDLPANETQGFWVDLYVPETAAPGTYDGVYRVTVLDATGESWGIPVSLTVWDFALPQTPTLVTEFGTPRLRDYYRRRAETRKESEPLDWDAVESQCARLLSEHRCNATPPAATLTPQPQPDGAYRIPSQQIQRLRAFIDQYHVNAVQIPHPSRAVKDPEAEHEKLRAWLGAFDRASREEEDYRYVQKWGRAIREAGTVVKVLVVEQPWTSPGMGGADSSWGDLYGAVDIWCPLFSLHRQESAAKRQALGEIVWTYTALCQGKPTPWWHIDFPLLNYRVPAWMAWRDGMKGLLYWGGMSYWRQTDDPWMQVPYYTGNGQAQQGAKGIVFQGEGSLVYPARAVGYDGVVPTIRLKALRDGIEDYEYLAILERSGKASAARQIVRSLTETFFEWEKNPAAYEEARSRLAALITSPATRR